MQARQVVNPFSQISSSPNVPGMMPKSSPMLGSAPTSVGSIKSGGMSSDMSKFLAGTGIAGTLLSSLFGSDYGDPMDYLNQIGTQGGKYLNPYINAGTSSIPILQEQYRNLINDPTAMMNKIGAGYHESPGFKFALDNALKSAANAQAAGGMIGTPQHEQYAMQTATGMADQDFNNYLKTALSQYNTGLSGFGDMFHTGSGAAESMSNLIAQQLASKAQLADANKTDWGSAFGNMAGMASKLIGFL